MKTIISITALLLILLVSCKKDQDAYTCYTTNGYGTVIDTTIVIASQRDIDILENPNHWICFKYVK